MANNKNSRFGLLRPAAAFGILGLLLSLGFMMTSESTSSVNFLTPSAAAQGASPSPTVAASPSPTVAASPSPTVAASPSPTATPLPTTRTVRIGNAATQPGQTVTVPITIDSLGNESVVNFSVNYNPAVLQNASFVLGNGVPAGTLQSLNLTQAPQGRIGISLNSPNAFAAGTRQIGTLTFQVAPGAPTGVYGVTFGSVPTAQSVTNAQGTAQTTVFTTANIQVGSTAAGVSVSGRVLTPDGRGLRNVVVSLIDQAGMKRTATTSSFGYYVFEDVEQGTSHVVNVASKRYRFSPRMVQVFDNITDLDFIGQE